MSTEPKTSVFERKLNRVSNKLNAQFQIMKRVHDNIGINDDKSFLESTSNIVTMREEFLSTLDERNEMLESKTDVSDDNYNLLIEFEELFSRIKYNRDLITSKQNRVTNTFNSNSQIKLPRLDLANFDGSEEAWPLFYENFKILVHHNENLSDGERIQYLISKLSGSALLVCKSIALSGENYEIIWNALIKKYNDKRVIGSTYLEKLLNLPNVKENSPADLENFIDKFSAIIAGLRQLKISSLEDFVFIHIGAKKVGLEIVKLFEMACDNREEMPSCAEFIEFVRNHAHILSRAQKTNPPSRKLSGAINKQIAYSKTFINVQEQKNCGLCKKSDHPISQCSKFMLMNPRERFQLIKRNKLCISCFNNSHTVRECNSKSKCDVCFNNHNTLLHFQCDDNSSSNKTQLQSKSPLDSGASSSNAALSLCTLGAPETNAIRYDTILLGTALCNFIDELGNLHVLRVLVDSASQRDLITLECCKKLQLKIFSNKCSISGVGDIKSGAQGSTSLTLRSRFDDSIRFCLQPLIVKSITNELPSTTIDRDRLDYLKNIPLADSSFDTPSKVDLILGSDLFARILKTNTVRRGLNEPVAIETVFGYIIVGKAPTIQSTLSAVQTYCTFENINRFFELEEVPSASLLTSEEVKCESFYNDTTTRDQSGRFVVSLPFKRDCSLLGDSMRLAERRFLSLERKLLSDTSVKMEYDSVIKNYLENGYLKPVDSDPQSCLNPHYVIPHHAVMRLDKSTTKLRIVMDASMKTSTGFSLNDLLHTGVNLQNDLFKIILNFRLFNIAISADIRQMYLRIQVDKHYWRFQRMLYRFDPSENIQMFEITRVPFGLCCSPYLALRTVRQLASDESARFPLAAAVAVRDLYMDDLVTSCSDAAYAADLSNELIKLFQAGGFDLVKFTSNSPEMLADIPMAHRALDTLEFSPENQMKVLGLHWLPAEDKFTFSVKLEHRPCTKRNILSSIARLWDLMGLIAPVTLLAKLIIKSLWIDKLDWDDKPPSSIVARWSQFESELPLLQKLKLPRHLGVTNDCVTTILGFADASESAYGGVVYVHVLFPNGDYKINLLCAKSRVSPLRNISLARLELCAILTLSKLMRFVVDTYSQRCKINNIYAYSDSMVALAWISSHPSRWSTFIANRVTKIQDNIDPNYFFHIAGKENPADCLSRGLTPAQLMDHPLWFHGPSFAHLPIEEWPVQRFDPKSGEDVPERKAKVMVATASISDPPLFYVLAHRISSWAKLRRIAVYILRFVRKLPKKFEVSHLHQSELAIIKDLQKVYFPVELENIQTGKKLSPSFCKLSAFMDNGILRVGGRLSNSKLNFETCHPVILPGRDHIVNLIIDYYHRKYLHTGPQLLMSLLRQRYWILSARNIVRKRVQLCNTCFRSKPRNEFPKMGDLPACRVQEAKPFCFTGVDYAGPLSIIPYRRRGVRSQKAYICLFVCLVTKAVHIELASDLSTDVFLNALKRFISRRGPVSVIYSDCGTNFVGAKSYLDGLYHLLASRDYQDKFANELSNTSITWKFNPPSSPHFGGIWESNIKSLKMHLSKVVGNQLFTFEEMLTILVQIEAILNSRPLSVLSSDPSEPLALTPAHFLTLTVLKDLPVEDISNRRINLLQRKQLVDHLVQSFWKRWKLEYLNTLQVRRKWVKSNENIQLGTVVLLRSDNSAPLDWPIGVIDKVYPGNDGVVRVVDVRTRTGVYRRPTLKVYPLPSQ